MGIDLTALERIAPVNLGAKLSEYTTFKIGGPAKFLTAPATPDALRAIVTECRRQDLPYFILGAGSNLLVADEGIDRMVIFTGGMNRVTVEGNTVRAEAGATLSTVCRYAAKAGLSGLEFAFGIPGTVGGGVYMNAGAYGGELKDVLTEVTVLDATHNFVTYTASDCDLSYRHSRFQSENAVVIEAVFTLKPDDEDDIKARMKEIIGKRKDKQPLEYPSAGSAFKRPEGAFAAALIDQCGLKGFSVGNAAVSEKHAGFIINLGNATCEDTCRLFMEVRRTVKEKTGYLLEPEVKLLGREWE